MSTFSEHYLVFTIFKSLPVSYTKEITTSTVTTTTNKVNAYSGSGPVMQILGQGRKYKYKLKRQGWYMQTQAPDW